MRAGWMRHRIALYSKSVTRNAYNEEINTPSLEDTVWGVVEDLRGREFEDRARYGAEITSRITIRYYDGAAPEWQAVWDGHTYDIIAVLPDTHKRQMQLICREVL